MVPPEKFICSSLEPCFFASSYKFHLNVKRLRPWTQMVLVCTCRVKDPGDNIVQCCLVGSVFCQPIQVSFACQVPEVMDADDAGVHL